MTITLVETGPVVGSRRCGHCSVNYEGRHIHCPGAIAGGAKGRLWVCPCGCSKLHCIKCKSTEGVNAETWTCDDGSACEATVASRLANSPTMQMIKRITEAAHERIAAEGHTRPRADRASTAPSFRPGAGKCECGCGTLTGSHFGMGHDARLRSVLAKAYVAGDEAAGVELAARGGVWAAKAPSVPAPADPDAFVAARVAERLA